MQLRIYRIINNKTNNDTPAVATTTVYVSQKHNLKGLHDNIFILSQLQTRVSSQVRTGSCVLKCVAVRGTTVRERVGARKGWLYIGFRILLYTGSVSALSLQDWANTGPAS